VGIQDVELSSFGLEQSPIMHPIFSQLLFLLAFVSVPHLVLLLDQMPLLISLFS
jgi:hypothetical protein